MESRTLGTTLLRHGSGMLVETTIFTYVYTCVREGSYMLYVCVSVNVYLNVSLYAFMSACLHVCTSVCMHACMHACMYACMYVIW